MIEELPMVSVIIPTFNRVLYVGEAVDSVLSQTYKNVEIIVIDDGSSDETGAYLRKTYAESKMVYHRFSTNRGVSCARNKGLNLASGDYVVFLDSDDTLRPTYIEKLVGRALELEDEVIMVQCQFSRCDIKDERVEPSRGIVQDEDPGAYIYLEKQSPSMSTYLVTLKTAREVGFNERLPRMVDHDFFIRYLARNPSVSFVNAPLLNYLNRDIISITKVSPPLSAMLDWFNGMENYMNSAAHAALALIIAEFAREHRDLRAWLKLTLYAVKVGNVGVKAVLGGTARWLMSDADYRRLRERVGLFLD